MNKPVGYLINTKNGLEGEQGVYYNYVLSQNGLSIKVDGALLSALLPLSSCLVRGLLPIEPYVVLKHGKIPQALFDLALNTSIASSEKEVYFAITWQDGYHLFMTPQEGEEAQVKYNVLENTLMDCHSHGAKMGAFFSSKDDEDELGFRLSCVIGLLKSPAVRVRAVAYGAFYPLKWSDVFAGQLCGVTETEIFREEVIGDELLPTPRVETEDCFDRGWWDRFYTSGWFM